jgi:BlaI family transcriptional regulator, penicillinase repressor
VLSRERALREAAGDLIERVFGGSVDALLMSLVKNRQLDKVTLAKMEKLIEMHEKTEDEHGSD